MQFGAASPAICPTLRRAGTTKPRIRFSFFFLVSCVREDGERGLRAHGESCPCRQVPSFLSNQQHDNQSNVNQPTHGQITDVPNLLVGTAVRNAARASEDNGHATHYRGNVSTSNRRSKDQPRESKGVRQSHGSRAFKRDQAKGYPMSSLNGTKAQRD